MGPGLPRPHLLPAAWGRVRLSGTLKGLHLAWRLLALTPLCKRWGQPDQCPAQWPHSHHPRGPFMCLCMLALPSLPLPAPLRVRLTAACQDMCVSEYTAAQIRLLPQVPDTAGAPTHIHTHMQLLCTCLLSCLPTPWRCMFLGVGSESRLTHRGRVLRPCMCQCVPAACTGCQEAG